MHYNALPPEVKQDLRKEYRLRLATIGAFLFAGLTFLLVLSLLPAFIAASAKESQLESASAALQKLKQDESTAQVVKQLAVTKSKMDALQSMQAPLTGSDVIAKTVGALSTGISLQSILYQPDGKSHKVTIMGNASTREALLAFQTNLEHTTPFLKADIPVDELAKNTDVSFTITVTGNF
jgi:hypothetical protein